MSASTSQGMAELIEATTTRQNPFIDPTLHVWGWEIPVYLFLGGLSAGLLVLPALLSMRPGTGRLPGVMRAAPLVSLLAITLGMVALFLDLELKSHVYRFYLSFEVKSPMSWGSWILLLVYPVGAMLWLQLQTAEERSLWGGRIPKRAFDWLDRNGSGLRWTSIGAGVALGAYTGLLLGTLGARPIWNSTLLGPLFLVSGVSTAAAFLLLFRPGGEVEHLLARWDMALIVTELSLLALLVLTLATGGRTARLASHELLGGAWTGVFWGVVVVLGLCVPLVLQIAEQRRRIAPAAITSILVLVGGLSLRWILVAAGQESSFSMVSW